MQAFTATVDTLYEAIVALSVRIVRGYIYAGDTHTENVHTEESHHVKQLPAPVVLQKIAPPKSTVSTDAVPAPIVRGVVMYAGVSQVPVYKNPTIEFDAQVGTIPFGAMVIAGEPKGRFHQVTWNNIIGWVLRDDLADRAVHIYPEFVKGEENLIDGTNTSLVRAIIKDEFGLGRSEFALQAGEYALYRLWKRGLEIRWPDIRPRVPGVWHEVLKGVDGVYMSVQPKVGALMEYMLDGEMGHIAYVEAVFPDETITISEVNNPDSGIYNEREYTKDEWKELKPVFIVVQ